MLRLQAPIPERFIADDPAKDARIRAAREALGDRMVPITYMNSSATIKAFVGEHGGAVYTSTNARAILEWAFKRGDKVLFLPDQHLGRNTGVAMVYGLAAMAIWDSAVTGDATRRPR